MSRYKVILSTSAVHFVEAPNERAACSIARGLESEAAYRLDSEATAELETSQEEQTK
jgi:hypothetical protein